MKSISHSSRREQFLSKIVDTCENAVAIIPANPELLRNDDVEHRYRQDSNFQYLTGFNEPESIAVLRNVGGKKEFILFVRPKDITKEIWTGFRAGVEGATARFGADKAYPLKDFDTLLPKLLQGADRVYYGFKRVLNNDGVEYLDEKVVRLLTQYRRSMGRTGMGMLPIYDANQVLGEMRLHKSAEEVDRMRFASDVSARAHVEAMRRCRPGLYEYQIEALLEYVFLDNGCMRNAYGGIVASGSNATVLHYRDNNRKMESGDLLLIDAAGEYDYYASDITRTFPVNGKFTKEQEEIYSIVLEVQKECVKMARPGASMAKLHAFCVDALTDAMIKLKFLSGPRQQLIDTLAYKRYFPHGTGHFLGMDVHDAGLYLKNGEPRSLEAGMAFTIEPGFYVLQDDSAVPESYRGIGVRIEDDVVITKDGCEVLTTGVPKEVKEVCALIGTQPWPAIGSKT